METGDGSRHWGPRGGSSFAQMGGFCHPPESIPPFMDPSPDSFLRKVAQVVQDTVARTLSEQQHGEDMTLSSTLTKIAKVNPPEFDGSKEPEDIINWMDDMEKLLTTFKCPEEQKVAIATHYLKKSAHEWWEACKPRDREPFWEEFKAKMEDRFYPGALRFAKEMEIIKPRPEDETVDQAAKMLYSVFHLNPSYSEDYKVSMFQARLSHEIREGLNHKKYKTLEKFVIKALNMEASIKASSGNSSNKRQKTDRCCVNCGSEQHVEEECTKSLRKCRGCGEFGHIVAYCTQRRNYY